MKATATFHGPSPAHSVTFYTSTAWTSANHIPFQHPGSSLKGPMEHRRSSIPADFDGPTRIGRDWQSPIRSSMSCILEPSPGKEPGGALLANSHILPSSELRFSK